MISSFTSYRVRYVGIGGLGDFTSTLLNLFLFECFGCDFGGWRTGM